MSEKGHNWLLVYPSKEKALEYLKSFCLTSTIYYACGYSVPIEGTEQHEVLIEHSVLCTPEKLRTRARIIIKQYGTRYSVFKKCVNPEKIFYEYGTRPTEQQNTMEDVISSFMDNEGDTESMYYKRYKTYLDSIRSKNSPLEGKVQLFGTLFIEKNILVYGGNEKKRNEYIEEITRGHSVYIKKTDKYWYKYQHEEFVIIKEISQLSFKKIISNLLTWSGIEEYEAEIYHNKIKMYPKDYRLIVSLKFDPTGLKKVSEEEKLLLSRFKIIELESDSISEENNEENKEDVNKNDSIKEQQKDISELIKGIDTSKAITENKPFTKTSCTKENKKENNKESKKVKLPKSDSKKKEKKETKKSKEKPKDTKKKSNKEEQNKEKKSETKTSTIIDLLKPVAIKSTNINSTSNNNNTTNKDKQEENKVLNIDELPPINNNKFDTIKKSDTITKEEKNINNNNLLLRKSTPYEETVSLETYQRIQNERPIKRTNSPMVGKTFEMNSINLNSFNDIMIEDDTSNDETKKINLDMNTNEEVIIQENPKELKHKVHHHSKERSNSQHKKHHKERHKEHHHKERNHTKEHHHTKESKKKEETKPKPSEVKKYRINLFEDF